MMDVFRRHQLLFFVLGIDVRNSLPIPARRALVIQFVLVMLFLTYHTYAFFLGVIWLRQNYPLIPTLIMSCGVITGFITFFKHQMLFRKREDFRLLMQELDGFVPDTTVGKYTKWLIFLYEIMGLFFSMASILKNLLESPDLVVPFPVWEPYEVDTFPRRALHFFCFYYAICIAWICMVSVDTAVLHLSNQLAYRFQLLDNTLALVGVPAGAERDEVTSKTKVLVLESYEDENLIKSCINEHVSLLRLTDTLASILNETFVYQSINSMAVLLVCLYIFANSKNWVNDTLAFSGALVVVFIQVLTSCWAGELLKTRCEGIHFSIYNNNWMDSVPKVKSTLLVMATFTSREVDFKGAFVFTLSLQTYETFIRQAFSFFTVMYQFLN